MTERKKIKYHQLTHDLDVENLSISTSILQKYIGWVYFTVLSYGLHYDHTTLNDALCLSILLACNCVIFIWVSARNDRWLWFAITIACQTMMGIWDLDEVFRAKKELESQNCNVYEMQQGFWLILVFFFCAEILANTRKDKKKWQ